ncbi:MAG: DUF4406 domain-containing protein [Prevotella sp.]|nr:DUF4406 domain-containing protein [Prevotella sp.]
MGERIYISGKIGEEVISEATRQKFAEAEKMLEERGFEPINITSDGIQRSMEVSFRWRELKPNYEDILLYGLNWLRTCTAIYMLPDFIDSPGAKAEHAFAIATGKHIYYDDELYRDGTLRGKGFAKNRLPEKANDEEA